MPRQHNLSSGKVLDAPHEGYRTEPTWDYQEWPGVGSRTVPLEPPEGIELPSQALSASTSRIERLLIDRLGIVAARKKALACASEVRKAGWVDQLIQEHAIMAELLRAEHVVLKNITEVQASVLALLGELGDEPSD